MDRARLHPYDRFRQGTLLVKPRIPSATIEKDQRKSYLKSGFPLTPLNSETQLKRTSTPWDTARIAIHNPFSEKSDPESPE
jgi:hypothetical protein